MNLIIDIGNTRIKTAIFSDDKLLHSQVFADVAEMLESDLTEKYEISRSILATVTDFPADLIKSLEQKFPVLIFKASTPVPIKNLYHTAATLGSDRLASAIGAQSVMPDKNLLVIDAGTCIKYNLVTSDNEYTGGAISPGLRMRFKAMNTFTGRLPLLSAEMNAGDPVGRSTAESIHSGAEWGAVYEMQGFIQEYEKLYSGLQVFLTGGDTEFFAGRLKNRIFADQFLVLKGLNRILEHNKK